MKIRKGWKKGVTTILASAILVSSIPSYGAAPRFKDVSASHWAYTYIEEMASLGYIAGTGDGKFLPDAPKGILNFDAAMSLMARLTNPTTTEKTNASYAYNALLNELKIEDWAKEGLAIALYKNIITESQLRTISKNGQIKKPISKINTCEYLVKAMGLEDTAKNKQIVSLTYKDVMSMSAIQTKYVSVLIDAGVLDPKGQGDGTFGPNTQLTRAVMAKMMSTAYDYMKGNPTTPTTPTTPETPKNETETLRTVMIKISDVGVYKFLMVEDTNGGEVAYQVMNNTSITVDGKATTYLGLAEGQEVELSIKKGTKELISVKATSLEEEISGKIKYLNSTASKMTVEYTEDKKTISKDFTVDKDADIYLDGKSVYLKNLKEGDLVDLKIKNAVIYDIEAESKEKKVEGIIKEITPVKDSRDKEYNITIVDSKDNTYKFLIDSKTYITRNSRVVKPEDLKLKDEAYIIAEYDVVKDIEAKVVKKNIKGQIRGLNIAFNQNTEVTILNQETKKEERYILGKDVYIRVDRVITNSRDLSVGHYVEVVTEGDEIVEIEADSKGLEASMLGKIQYINSRTREITLLIENFDLDSSKYGDEIAVYVKSDVVVADRNLKSISFSDLRRGDRINVIGSYDGFSFIANTIQLR
ncbi:S-layer homology domain-containing protein [Tissierella sp. P1]|uniref:S-layer homology domain-containing protein n=1 Tax=Tissierella sp. P1 TaxID=1280483 RepID=UPI001180695E|nr:S-layer homology domain-containing protein [Tissierella sp. P1]